MCGITGLFGRTPLSWNADHTISQMTLALQHRGPDATGFFTSAHVRLGHRRLAIIDLSNGAQPMTIDYKGSRYTIVFNGEIYNYRSLKNELETLGFVFSTESDTEVLLLSYVAWKEQVVDHLVGIFAFAVTHDDQLFIARDHLGVKPLYYYDDGDCFRFASEIKALFADSSVPRIIDGYGWMELYGLGPTLTPGKTPFKGIKSLPPGHYLQITEKVVTINRYFELTSAPHLDSLPESIQKIQTMMSDIITMQMQSDVGVSSFLSGGLDSSIITALASKNHSIDTYSIDYLDNDLHFTSNTFQVSRDPQFARLGAEYFGTNHQEIIMNTNDLIDELIPSMIARDMPGMADIDGSLRFLAHQVHKDHKVVLSGECADELFGGYPWFYSNNSDISSFPWLRHMDFRIDLLATPWKSLPYLDYINSSLQTTLSRVKRLPGESDESYRWHQMTYLNVYWFMQNLLTRKDSQTMAQSLEARVPFADYRLAQYAFNLPPEYKYREGQEKWILREAFKDILPETIYQRKKNPYPKTFHPEYTRHATKLLIERMSNSTSVLPRLFDLTKLGQLVEPTTNQDTIPWFGQLMNRPQLIAYLYQLDVFFEHYHIQLEDPQA